MANGNELLFEQYADAQGIKTFTTLKVRDFFAAAAIAGSAVSYDAEPAIRAKRAYALADAMVAERDRNNGAVQVDLVAGLASKVP